MMTQLDRRNVLLWVKSSHWTDRDRMTAFGDKADIWLIEEVWLAGTVVFADDV